MYPFLVAFVSLLLVGGLTAPAHAALTVAGIFGNHAVLQRNMPAPVWGTANANEQVTVTYKGSTVSIRAAADGTWRVDLPPMEATSGSSDMVISAASGAITLVDVQVGEVWVGSGQSNMDQPLQFDSDPTAIPDSGNYNIRLYNAGSGGGWQISDSTTAPSFSDTLWFFGRYLAKALPPGVAVGLIEAAKSGTAIETWSTRAGSGTNYLALVKPLQPYAIRGVLWWQGEADTKSLKDAEAYYAQLPTLIDEWRTDWRQGSFPFYVTQLEPYGSTYVRVIRDAQLQAALSGDPDTWTAFNIAYPENIVHPHYREPFAYRLFRLAQKNVYGQDVVPCGPIANVNKSSISGNQVVVGFDFVGAGLKTESDGAPTEWEIAGGDGIYHPATASLNSTTNTVVLTSSSVQNPVSVRYAYTDVPTTPNLLLNSDDLEATPIRELRPLVATTPPQDYFCSTLSLNTGTLKSGGDCSTVHDSDNVYLVVGSARSGSKQSTQVTYTFNTGLNSLSSLSFTVEGRVSVGSQPQTVYLYNYSTSAWVSVGKTTLTTTDTTAMANVSSPANYISGGTVQVRVKAGGSGSTAFDSSTDLVKIRAAP